MSRPKSPKKGPVKTSQPTDRVHVYYSGRVQGVGFRHTTEQVALELGLLGWVKNLHDGRVEVLAEGSREQLEKFLADIQSGPLGRFIKKCDCSWGSPSGEFSDFCVEFCY